LNEPKYPKHALRLVSFVLEEENQEGAQTTRLQTKKLKTIRNSRQNCYSKEEERKTKPKEARKATLTLSSRSAYLFLIS
jgi:hypothetical protein